MEIRVLSKRKLRKERENIEKQIERLYLIKNILDETANLIDITNVYVLKIKNLRFLVYLEKHYNTKHYHNPYLLKLINIFNDEVMIEMEFRYEPNLEFWICNDNIRCIIKDGGYNGYTCTLKCILDVEPTLIAYTDGMVPDYILKELLMKLNKVDVNHPLLTLNKKNKR